MERLRKSDYEEIISRDSAGKSQYRDTSIIHILFQSENLWKRKQFSEAVSRKNKSISKQYFISLTMIWYIYSSDTLVTSLNLKRKKIYDTIHLWACVKEKFLVQFHDERWGVSTTGTFAKKYFNHTLVRGINDILA